MHFAGLCRCVTSSLVHFSLVSIRFQVTLTVVVVAVVVCRSASGLRDVIVTSPRARWQSSHGYAPSRNVVRVCCLSDFRLGGREINSFPPLSPEIAAEFHKNPRRSSTLNPSPSGGSDRSGSPRGLHEPHRPGRAAGIRTRSAPGSSGQRWRSDVLVLTCSRFVCFAEIVKSSST
jgi:hypothetical protein